MESVYYGYYSRYRYSSITDKFLISSLLQLTIQVPILNFCLLSAQSEDLLNNVLLNFNAGLKAIYIRHCRKEDIQTSINKREHWSLLASEVKRYQVVWLGNSGSPNSSTLTPSWKKWFSNDKIKGQQENFWRKTTQGWIKETRKFHGTKMIGHELIYFIPDIYMIVHKHHRYLPAYTFKKYYWN